MPKEFPPEFKGVRSGAAGRERCTRADQGRMGACAGATKPPSVGRTVGARARPATGVAKGQPDRQPKASSKKATTRRSYAAGRVRSPSMWVLSGISQIVFGAPARS